MSLSLPLKYRPELFRDLVGQTINAKFFSALIKKGQIGKNVILYGPYGSSKTTSCRIYARALNCLDPTSTGEPCNTCDHCNAFYDGTFPDYLEVDGASRGTKDKIQELQDIARTPPLYGRYRVINIDECQGLSKQAWDALLKLIEEPPPFLVFIFTTTEVDKVREAIRSRCQCMEVKLLDPSDAKTHVRNICESEGFRYDEQAVELIVFLSRGHPRDLVKNIEQCTYLGDVVIDNAKEIFNIGYIQFLVKYFVALIQNKHEDVIKNLRDWHDTPERITYTLKEFVLFLQYNYIYQTEAVVNPAFKFIPKKDVQGIWNSFATICERVNVPPTDAFASLFKVFNSAKVDSQVAIEVFSINLLNLMHKQNFNNGSFGQPLVDTSEKEKGPSKKKKNLGRQFIQIGDTTQEPQPTVIPVATQPIPEVPQNATETNQAVYAHTLLEHGFDARPLSGLNMQNVED